MEWEICLCFPKNGWRIFPANVPAGIFCQKSEVGLSISGVKPPIKQATAENIAVESVISGIGCVRVIMFSAVIAAKS